MAEISKRSIFSDAALMSGLLTQDQLDMAMRVACEAGGVDAPLSSDAVDDQLLADKVVELEFLNAWQAEHLRAGRTKFTLGPYKILDALGQGGMGHVFKAEHTLLGRIEAVKVLPKSKTSPESIAKFHQEIRAQAQLDHPNLVRVSYAGQDGSTHFFVTEYVAGTDLRRLVRTEGKLSMTQAATIISQAAQALDHAHQRGLAHRDVKPGNLLVTPDGHTKVTDLGLAGFLHESPDDDDSRAGKIVGTADYLAPEAIKKPAEVLPVSDIYSLGCTLYYAVTGKVPFPGGTTLEKLRRHCNETPHNPKRFNASLDNAFLDVLADLMEKDPAQRVATAAEVVHRLAPWTRDTVPQSQKLSRDVARKKKSAPPPLPAGDHAPPHFLDESSSGIFDLESPSQLSQFTDPVSSALEETERFDDAVEVLDTRFPWLGGMLDRALRWRPTPDQLATLLVPILLTVAIVLTLILFVVIR